MNLTTQTIRTRRRRKNGLRLILALVAALVAALVVITPALAQRRERVIETWKPLHYDVAIVFNDQLTELASARTEISVEVLTVNLTKLDLDFGEMPVDSVSVSGEPTHFEQKPEVLNVALPRAANPGDKLSVVVTYHGRPKDGLIFASDRDGKPSATGDNWPNRVHQWIPSFDHPSAKATVSFTVSAPPRDVVVANGKFVTITRNGAAPSVWRFEETKPIPPYCMVIVVNEGAKLDAKVPSITPLSYYVPRRDLSYTPKGFSVAAPALSLFSETIAPYPYEKLALIVGTTRFGGMENSSAIVFTSTLFDLLPNEKLSKHFGIPERIENVVAHEIAHQWFGDSVTESTWADLWLSEGFATYFAGLFIEKYDGEEAFRDYLRNAAERYFAYEKQRLAPIHDTETQDLMRLLNANNYEKGAWVLHMLRATMGDKAFFGGLRDYYESHRDANATTEDLRGALEKASEQDLKEFFARWVYGSGHPVYELSWEWNSSVRKVKLLLRQLQMGPAFLDAIPVDVVTANGKLRIILRPKSKESIEESNLNHAPSAVNIDPENTLLKEVTVIRRN